MSPTQNPVPGLVLPAVNAARLPGRQVQVGGSAGSGQQGADLHSVGTATIPDASTAKALGAVQRWAKGVSPRMLFADGVGLVNGLTPPTPPSDAYLIGGGSPVVTFTTGIAPVTFPVAFPNDIAWIMVSNPAGTAAVDDFNFQDATLSGFNVTSSVAGTGNATICYTVVGW